MSDLAGWDPENVWFTSDRHFGHANILRLSDRPYASIAEHDLDLVERHNAVVKPGDVVFVLGDEAKDVTPDPDIIGALNGTQILIAGNHDPCWDALPGSDRMFAWYYEAGYADVCTRGWMTTHLPGIEPEVLLTHIPPVGDYPNRPPRYVNNRPPFDSGIVLCGHLHETWKTHNVGPLRQLNVGVDQWEYTPVNLTTIIEWVDAGCPDLPGRDG